MDPRYQAGLDRVRVLLEPILASLGLELVDLLLGGSPKRPNIQIFVDGPQGVRLDDCAQVSRALGARIEETGDPFPAGYSLEVSSPGLDRPIRSEADFRRNLGRKVQVQLREARPGGVEKLVGTLVEADPAGFVIEAEDGSRQQCRLDDVRKVHRAIEFRESSP